MMYRPNIAPPPQPRHRRRRLKVRPLLVLLACVAFVGVMYGFISHGRTEKDEVATILVCQHQEPQGQAVVRLCRSEIPRLNMNTVHYRELFNDTNSTQMEAAQRNGLRHPERVDDPGRCSDLVRVASCDLYVVDSLYHSKPYLVPEAALMLTMIGERFQELLAEQYPGKAYRPIVTSLLRSAHDVERLRHVNRNASENSCHIYGTTVDISYTRFRLTDETDTVDHNELYLKNLLTQVLYELRYEGLIYVKYERGGCYHLTLRNAEYKGHLRSEQRHYALDRPHAPQKPSPRPKQKPKQESNQQQQTQQRNNFVEI